MEPKTRDLAWGLGSAALIVIGSLGPWAKLGPFSVSGTDGDGVITLILGLIAVGLIFADRWAWAVLIAAFVSAMVGIYDTLDMSSAGNDLIEPSPGWGVIIVEIAGVSLFVWSGRKIVAGRRGPAGPRSAMPNGDMAPHRVDRP